MTVEQIDSLAAAFHYFVWPNAPIDYGYKHMLNSVNMNESVGAIHYAKELGMDSTQIDIFYCKVAELTLPNHIDRTICYWRDKHDRVANEYVPNKPHSKYSSDTFQTIQLDSAGRDIP